MDFEDIQKNLRHLDAKIDKDFELLEDYKDALRYEINPKLKRQYRNEIEVLNNSISGSFQEKQKLQQDFNNNPSLQTPQINHQFEQINDKLDDLDEKANLLIIGQGHILYDLKGTREELLKRYDFTEQHIISNITQEFNESQIALARKLVYAIEANKVSEPEMQQMLASVEKRLPSLPPAQVQPVTEILTNPEVAVRHKLKLALPIIPMLLDWETEFEIGNGVKPKILWEQIIAKLGRQPKPKLTGNYQQLRELLESGKWQEADLVTTRLIIASVGREKQGWLRQEDIEKVPCVDLRAINNLWKNISQGKFGFSIQRQIWLEIIPLGKSFDPYFFHQFGDRVGWHNQDEWLKYEQFNFSLDAPQGHLPSFPITSIINDKNDPRMRKDNFRDLLLKMETC
ncbi:MAG: GUN4 domain-containing protein [Sphaerospermopsis sp. SIO1G2]|nr:GUN4 domain-containing protein [Sphaerospermopsis sp. SIO1G2]